MEIGGVPLDLGKVAIPTYFVADKDDHIAPAASVYRGARLFGGDVRYTMAGSGHIAGIMNPAAKDKYVYSIGPKPASELEGWVSQSIEHAGSWWSDWIAWLTARAPERVAPRHAGSGGLPRALSRARAGVIRPPEPSSTSRCGGLCA